MLAGDRVDTTRAAWSRFAAFLEALSYGDVDDAAAWHATMMQGVV